MKRFIALLPLLGCACAPGALNLTRGAAAPVPAGEISVIGSYGGEIDPGSLWIDRTGAVYLTDRARWRMLSYRCDGDSCPVRLVQDLPNPGMYLVPGYDEGYCLADNAGRKIIYYSASGTQVGMLKVDARDISAAAICSTGDVYVLDAPQRTMAIYNSRGALLRQFTTAGETGANPGSALALAVNRPGDMVAIADAAGGIIVLYNAFGRSLAHYRIPAVALAFDSYDRLWSLDGTGRITVRSGSGLDQGSVWPDSVRVPGRAGLIAAGHGDRVLMAAAGVFLLGK